MLKKLGIDPACPAAWFPADLTQRLAQLESSGGTLEQWEHPTRERTFARRIHFLDDFHVFHAYLWDITDRKHAEHELIHQAYHDALPDRGMVSPAEFVPLAEESGLIVPIGEWMLRTACAQARAWQGLGLPALTAAVNISARQFHSRDPK